MAQKVDGAAAKDALLGVFDEVTFEQGKNRVQMAASMDICNLVESCLRPWRRPNQSGVL
jgi:hypothetical protein